MRIAERRGSSLKSAPCNPRTDDGIECVFVRGRSSVQSTPAAPLTASPAQPLARCGSRLTWLQEREIAALIGAEDFLGIKPGIAERGFFRRRLGGGGAALEFRIVDGEVDAAALDRKPDAVAVAHQAARAAGGAVRRHVQHD